jgi:hypothetical protein
MSVVSVMPSVGDLQVGQSVWIGHDITKDSPTWLTGWLMILHEAIANV